MGSMSCMWSVADWNVIMWHMTVSTLIPKYWVIHNTNMLACHNDKWTWISGVRTPAARNTCYFVYHTFQWDWTRTIKVKHYSSNFYHCTVHLDIIKVFCLPTIIISVSENIKIYIKTYIKIAPTCFGLWPSSGSLHMSLAKVTFIKSVKVRHYGLCGCVAACMFSKTDIKCICW
jgi:hypothetical protein